MENARVLKWWSKRNLPGDLWPDILSRLPVKSLLRFRCVCRSLKACIDNPDFARLHLTRSQSQILLVLSQTGQCVVKNSETLVTTSTHGFLHSDPKSPDVLKSTSASSYYDPYWWYICSSIDGLFLLHSFHPPQSEPNLMLWNPSIQKTLLLPLPNIPSLHASYRVEFGLGFDPLTRDYKAVKFFLLPHKGVHFVAVYTLETTSWKLIECGIEVRKELAFHFWQPSISFNGILYAFAIDYQTNFMKLVSFDLRSEVFTSFELPVTDSNNYDLSIIDDGRSLALIHLYKSNLSVWALEGLGNDSKAWSWIQRHNFVMVRPDPLYHYEFLCIKKNGEMLLKWNNMVVCYNLETQERKIFMEKNKTRFYASNTFNYKESLIIHS